MRLDRALVERGLARSRGQAVELVRQGLVRVNGLTAAKASLVVGENDVIEATPDTYVSRAAHKLAAALDESTTRVAGRVLDAGASTGGFTQVVLERGAEQVYAVDVGHGQLALIIRSDPRVVVWEGVNLRDLTLDHVEGEPVDLVVGDVSFISLTLLLEPILFVLKPSGVALLLVKPQFEVGRGRLNDHGVVTDEGERQAAQDRVVAAARDLGWTCDWHGVSRWPGTHGNTEYFIRLRRA